MRNWRKNNRDKDLIYRQRVYAKQLADPAIRMRQRAFSTITRAKRDGIEYDRETLFNVAASPPCNCMVCGNKIDYSFDAGNKPLSNGPSFDRWNNNKGYVPGNVNIICRRCNTFKGSMSITDITNLRDYMMANHE